MSILKCHNIHDLKLETDNLNNTEIFKLIFEELSTHGDIITELLRIEN